MLGRLCRATNRLGKVLPRVIHLENRTLKESGTERFFGAPYMQVITFAVSHARRAEWPLSPRKRSLRDQCGYFLYSAFIFFPPSSPQHPHQPSVKDFNHFFSLNFCLVFLSGADCSCFCFVLFSWGHSHNGSSA